MSNSKELLDEIRTSNLDLTGNLLFEIDLKENRIESAPPLDEETTAYHQIADRLSPSFIAFIKNYANGLHIDIGNALTIFPVSKPSEGLPYTVSSESKQGLNPILAPEFLVFGRSGVDVELFCFYTGMKLTNGEYPVVWYSPALTGSAQFVLLNSGFDKFLSIQYYLLRAKDLDENEEGLEEIMNDPYYMKNPLYIAALEKAERNSQNFHDLLYCTFDPEVPKPNHNYYACLVSYQELINQINQLNGIIR